MKQIEKIRKSKTWLFEKFKQNPQIPIIGMKVWTSQGRFYKYQHIIREYRDQLQIYTFNNLGEIHTFLQGRKYLK